MPKAIYVQTLGNPRSPELISCRANDQAYQSSALGHFCTGWDMLQVATTGTPVLPAPLQLTKVTWWSTKTF
jgi:hypothetical protein